MGQNCAELKYLPALTPVDIEFRDLIYSVPDAGGKKVILRGINGKFKCSQLTAILGPSGAGKSTLLNILAGFKCGNATGNIKINGHPRDIRTFRKMCRYIMQKDLFQPLLSAKEAMMVSVDLKLGKKLTKKEKMDVIDEILELLRLSEAANTMCNKLSGGELKRLSIALELVNNPPVIFLDEPTSGLDDLSCSQCIELLKRIAHTGRTIICSIHTPSAKIFEMFDHVYVLAAGQCVYSGQGSNIVPYIHSIGLSCPITYNPADFVIEVSAGEYGYEFVERMVKLIENGRCTNWSPNHDDSSVISFDDFNEDVNQLSDVKTPTEIIEGENISKFLHFHSSSWDQFVILYKRRNKQTWRDTGYIKLKVYMTVFLGLVVGGIYQGFGNDASRAIFNFGFCFTVTIAFMYNPMMPVLLQFPTEVQLLKREYFNHWFRIGPYYWAMLASKLPLQIILSVSYVTMIYLISDQPLEFNRMAMFYSISILLALTSESLGVLLASRLSLINGMFIGPVVTVPLMLLAVYGIGYGKNVYIPAFIRFLMSLSYLRYGLEGLISALYGYDRQDTICPETEMYCIFKKPHFLRSILGFGNIDFPMALLGLSLNYITFTLLAFLMLRMRLNNNSNYWAMQQIRRFVKTYLNVSSY